MTFLALVLALQTQEIENNVVYREIEGQAMMFDIYRPADLAPRPTPLVIVIHGGAWVSGARGDMGSMCEAIAAQGMTAATVSYRLAPRFRWPSMLDDVQAAVRYFRANHEKYQINPDAIGAVGASAGGHLALLLGAMDGDGEEGEPSSRVQAVFNIFGPTDMQNDFDPGIATLLSFQVIGKPMSEAQAIIETLSPVKHIDGRMAPTFTLHGTADPLVPVRQASRLDEVLKKFNVEHDMRIIEGMGHNVNLQNEDVRKAVEDGIKFLQRHLTAKPEEREDGAPLRIAI